MKSNIQLLLLCLLSANLLNAQQFHINENFNTSGLPSGWTNSAISGSQNWSFGINGATAHAGNQNLNGSAMAYFDDDALGGGSVNNTVSLVTPVFDNSLNSITTLEFDYNFREFGGTNPADSFKVEVYDGTNWNLVFFTNTNDCGNYLQSTCVGNYPHATVNISSYANSNCQVRFIYHDGNDWAWYVGLDNVTISSPLADDIQVSQILSPQSDCGLSASETVLVTVKNRGSASVINPFSVVLDINNGSQVLTETITTTIPAGDSINYTFIATVNFSAISNYALVAYTNYTSDLNTANDTTKKTIENSPIINLPYFDDFETQNLWSTSGTNSSWSLGNPSGNFIDSAFSGNNAYVTNLSGPYNNLETSYLTSPCLDFSNSVGDPFISFNLIYNIESDFDKLTMESSIDGGTSWQVVQASALSNNWYNQSNAYWDGVSSGWINVRNRLSNLGGQSNVILRFKLKADGSGTFEGAGIDDFAIFNGDSIDLFLMDIAYPGQTLACGVDSSNISLQIMNTGIQPIDTTYLFYQVNGGGINSDTLIQTIPPNTQTTTLSTNKFAFNASNNSIDAWIKTPRSTQSSNDSILNYSFLNNTSNSYTIPYIENFDSFRAGTTFSNPDDSLVNDWTRISIFSNNYSWRVADSIVANRSTGTGPASDVTGGNFMYTEASVGNSGDEATLTSPCIQINQNTNLTLEFYTHRFGNDIGSLFIDFYDGINWNTIDTITTKPQTQQGSSWTKQKYSVTAIPNSIVKIRFRASKLNSGFAGDIAVDNVQLYEASDLDVAITGIGSPSNRCDLTNSETIRINIDNNGILDVLPNTLSVNYKIDNNPTVTELITIDTIKPNTTLSYPFSQLADLSVAGKTYSLTIFSSLVGDANFFNDTFKTKVTNLTAPLSYSENFENTSNNTSCQGLGSAIYIPYLPLGWSDISNSWIVQNTTNCGGFGNSQGATGSASTGPSGAHTGSNFIYLEIDVNTAAPKILKTTCLDFTNDSNITLEFWYHKYGSGMGDLFIEVENSNGIVFTVDSILGQTQPFNSASWLKRTISLDSFAGQKVKVLFRAEITSGAGRFQGDMAIDDILIFNPLPVSINKEKVNQNLFSLYPNPNSGLFTLNVSNETVGSMYRIFDMKGSLIKSSIINSPTSQIQLNEVDKGIYFLQIEGLGKTEKIVIQ